MRKNRGGCVWTVSMLLVLAATAVFAQPKPAKLAKKLLHGDEATRLEAIKAFNKMPPDAQYTLVPDFMVALTDEDPQVRKIASRILKAMNVTATTAVPDAKKEMPLSPTPSKTEAKKQLVEEKKLDEPIVPDLRTAPVPPPTPASPDPWADLKNVRGDAKGNYADMKREIEREKKGQVTLDANDLRSDMAASSPMGSVMNSLKDPDPWVRAQAARRLGIVRPAPVETIPTLVEMLQDKNTDVRLAAAGALGSFGPLAREAIPALNKALTDSDYNVSLIAADALKQIQQPR